MTEQILRTEFQSRLRCLTACLSMYRTVSRYDQPRVSAASTVNAAAWAALPRPARARDVWFHLHIEQCKFGVSPCTCSQREAPKNTEQPISNLIQSNGSERAKGLPRVVAPLLYFLVFRVGRSLFQQDDARIRNSKDVPTIRHDAVRVVTASHDWKCPMPILRLHRFVVRSGRKHGHSDLFDDDAVAPSSEAAARTTSACCASGSGMSSRAPGLSRRTIHDGGKEPMRPGRDCSQRLAHSLSSYLSTCRRSCPITKISGCFLATFKRGRVEWTLVLAHKTLAPRFSMNSSMVSL